MCIAEGAENEDESKNVEKKKPLTFENSLHILPSLKWNNSQTKMCSSFELNREGVWPESGLA